MEDYQLVRLPRVIELVGLRRSSIYKAVRLGRFPAPVALTRRARAWRLAEVRKWIDERPSIG